MSALPRCLMILRRAQRSPGILIAKEVYPRIERRYSHFDGTFSSNLPQTVDLLERYRGLVTLGTIKYDEEQVRVVMQVSAPA